MNASELTFNDIIITDQDISIIENNNVFYGTVVKNGKHYLGTGDLTPSTIKSQYEEEYLPVKENTSYSWRLFSTLNLQICVYDKDKVHIIRLDTTKLMSSVTIPANGAFVRISNYDNPFVKDFFFCETSKLNPRSLLYSNKKINYDNLENDTIVKINGLSTITEKDENVVISSNIFIDAVTVLPYEIGEGYHAYKFRVPDDIDIWHDATFDRRTVMAIYDDIECHSPAKLLRYDSNETTGNKKFPTEDNKVSVHRGQYVLIATDSLTYTDGFKLNFSKSNIKYKLSENVCFSDAMKLQINSNAAGKAHISYDASLSTFSIFLSYKSGFLQYDISKLEDNEKNASVWKIKDINYVDDKHNLLLEIGNCSNAELEMAIKLDGRNDFFGGIAHGDEIAQEISVLVDGCSIVDFNTLSSQYFFNDVNIKIRSFDYDPIVGSKLNDDESTKTKIAIHDVDYQFSDNDMILTLRLEWINENALSVTLAYMPMNIALKRFDNKTITDSIYLNDDIRTLSALSYAQYGSKILQSNDISSILLFSNANMTAARLQILDLNGSNGNKFKATVSDNSTTTYNKVYIDLISSTYAVTNGIIWNDKIRFTYNSNSKTNYILCQSNYNSRYALLQKQLALSTITLDGVLTLALTCAAEDLAITTILVSTDAYPVAVYLPVSSDIGSRDFCVRVEALSSSIPSLCFLGSNAESCDFESEDEDWATLKVGANLFNFTETKR